MRRILFVSCNYASDYGPMVWGTYLRMRILLEGAVHAADQVALLLFVAPDALLAARENSVAASIKKHWGLDVQVHFAVRSAMTQSRWLSTARGLFAMKFQPDYGDAGGVEQARAVGMAMTEDTELVVAHRLDASIACLAGVRDQVPIVLNLDDVEHVAKQRRLDREPASWRTILRRLEWSAIRRYELRALRSVSTALVCSDAEAAYLQRLIPALSIDVIKNAVHFPDVQRSKSSDGKTVMFIGSYGYQPNIDAVEELIETIFPMIAARMPDARLLIAGARSDRLRRMSQIDPTIEILGFVDDVAEIYARADVVCCPIRAGGGTRIKIIEAAAWKVATVSTPLGAEGLDFVDGREIVLAETPDALANACIRLLQNPEAAHSIAEAAFDKAAREFRHDAVAEQAAVSYRETQRRGSRDRRRRDEGRTRVRP